jgi:cullin 3
LSFEELYRNAYNMVLHKFGEKLYSGRVTTMTGLLREMAKTIEAAQGSLFLEGLNRKLVDHNKTPVHELGLNLWRDHIVRAAKIKDRLLNTLLKLYVVNKQEKSSIEV